jgi:RES domain-containing protein
MDGPIEFIAFRLTTARYQFILDGAGSAKSTHNRWNRFGQSVTYAASSRALALLEMRVHSAVGPPKDAVISVIRIVLPPEQVGKIEASELPDGWRDPHNVLPCQLRGSRWYTERPEEKLLIAPSAIVPAEAIYVIRGGIDEVQVVNVEPFDFDPRLWESDHIDKDRVYTRLLIS